MVPLETISYSTKVLVLGWAQMIDLEGHLGPQKDYLLTVGNFSTLMKLFLKRLCVLCSQDVEKWSWNRAGSPFHLAHCC